MHKTPLLTAAQMRDADRATIDAGTSEDALMRSAARELAAVVSSLYTPRRCVVVVGAGNNGKDGSIAAELLKSAGWNVEICDAEQATETLKDAELIIDALLGTGLNKPVSGDYARAIEAINNAACPVVAVDIPSGINASTGEVMGVAVKATHTVTFAAAKCGHYLLPGKIHTGQLHIMDIGIDPETINATTPHVFLNTPPTLPEPALDAHKYSRGHALIQGGALASTGAAKLAANAALKVGAGAVSVLCDAGTLPIYATSFQAVMTKQTYTHDAFYAAVHEPRVKALAIGCGAGISDATQKRTHVMLDTNLPCVVDADALQKDILPALHARCVITPHAGEFERLFGVHTHKLSAIKAATDHVKSVVVYKGNDTVIAQAGKPIIIHPDAPATLATAGSGDVLTGLITGLLAQGMEPFDAACAAVWLHSEAAKSCGRFVTAEDLISALR